MKRFLIAPLFLFLSVSVHAVEKIWKSSTTVTSTVSSVAVLCTATQRGIFHGVCTDFGVAASSITVVNSTWTVTGVKQIGPISTNVADQCKYYDTFFINGLGYSKTNTAGVTVLYDCY